MGSGHILVYAFDVLMQIYTSAGWSERDAAKSIIENNIYGLDIDDRAGQLAYFAVMMKARKYSRRIMKLGLQPNVMSIQDASFMTNEFIDFVADNDTKMKSNLRRIKEVFTDAKEYGSILNVPSLGYEAILDRISEIQASLVHDVFQIGYRGIAVEKLLPLIKQAMIMSQKYDVVVTNPPYMSISNTSANVNEYVIDNYPDAKADLYTIFIDKCSRMIKPNAYQAMITQHGWMFLGSFEKMRTKLIKGTVLSMVHLGARAFEEIGGEVVQTTAFVFNNKKDFCFKGKYVRLVDYPSQQSKEEAFLLHGNEYICSCEQFRCIPGNPFAYWISKSFADAFHKQLLSDYAETKQGFATGNNNLFLRCWYEVSSANSQLESTTREQAKVSTNKWFPCNKGGGYRKWYGNNTYLVNWEFNGREMRGFQGSVIRNPQYYFLPGITWSSLANKLSLRYSPEGFVFESKGSMCFPHKQEDLLYLLGILNSKIASEALSVLSPTLDFHEGPMSKVPVVMIPNKENPERIVKENITICKDDYDSFETSWDFMKHPLI